MSDIEEAWAILGERCWWNSRTAAGEQDHVGAEKMAARALALAVLEEALRWPTDKCPGCGAERVRNPAEDLVTVHLGGCGYREQSQAAARLRQRLEKLGDA